MIPIRHFFRPFFFQFVLNYCYDIFSSSLTLDHTQLKTSPTKVHTHTYSPKACVFIGSVFTKFLERTVKFHIGYFAILHLLMCDHTRVKVLREISSQSTQQIHSTNYKIHAYSCGWYLSTLLHLLNGFEPF